MNTSELTGAALDWAVAKCEGATDEWHTDKPFFWDGVPCVRAAGYDVQYSPSTNWAQAGPIIERERITLNYENLYGTGLNQAYYLSTLFDDDIDGWMQNGPTALIAAMRCYVTRKLGEEVDVPVELINQGETA